jgi:hypothetical protein
MFQHSAGPDSWNHRRIPLWFREGMAIWTAKQGGQYPTLEDTANWVQQHPELGVFRDGERLSRDFAGPVYGLSLHAFSFLVRRYGQSAIVSLMASMKGGATFPEAFRATVGIDAKSFQQDFETYLELRGFRGWAKPVGRPPKRLDELLRSRPPPQGQPVPSGELRR